MAMLSYDLIEEILDVAETYAAKEKERLSRLAPAQGQPAAHAPRANAVGDKRRRNNAPKG